MTLTHKIRLNRRNILHLNIMSIEQCFSSGGFESLALQRVVGTGFLVQGEFGIVDGFVDNVLVCIRFEDLSCEFNLVFLIIILNLQVYISYDLDILRNLRAVLAIHCHQITSFDRWELVGNVQYFTN